MSKETIASWVGSVFLRIYARTLRIHFDLRTEIEPGSPPLLWVFWHNRMLLVPLVYRRLYGKRPGVVLTSASRDGGMLAAFMKRFSFEAARGSSSRRGARALLELTRWVRRGYDVGITPDGPRGPRYQLGPGVLLLAQKSAADIIPLTINYSSFKHLKSWDRFMIPLPFSRVSVIVGERFTVPETASESGFEAIRAQLEGILNQARNDSL